MKRLRKILMGLMGMCAVLTLVSTNEAKASENIVVGGHIPICSYHDALPVGLKLATFDENGSRTTECPECDFKSEEIIYAVTNIELSNTRYTYDGKVKTPTVVIKDSKGTLLTEGEDYKLVLDAGRVKIGKYAVVVDLIGNYEGTKTLYFTIVPKAPTSASAVLYGHDDIKFNWKKVPGASGYTVWYKKNTSSEYTVLKHTTSTSVKKANLSDGIKYNFKVAAYVKIDGVKYYSAEKKASTTTLAKVKQPTVVRSSNSKVKVSWTNIGGETGYQISKSTSKSRTNIVSTYKTTSGKSKKISATAGKGYYYKVRAYKTVDGKKIYGPWSSTKYFKK